VCWALSLTLYVLASDSGIGCESNFVVCTAQALMPAFIPACMCCAAERQHGDLQASSFEV
jgi:hypothetical protein